MDERVAMAISHWAARFTTNGVTAGDFERITGAPPRQPVPQVNDRLAGIRRVPAPPIGS